VGKSPEQWRRERTLYPVLIFAAGLGLMWWVHTLTFDLDAAKEKISSEISRSMMGSQKFQ
jgi:hypothetical protein